MILLFTLSATLMKVDKKRYLHLSPCAIFETHHTMTQQPQLGFLSSAIGFVNSSPEPLPAAGLVEEATELLVHLCTRSRCV